MQVAMATGGVSRQTVEQKMGPILHQELRGLGGGGGQGSSTELSIPCIIFKTEEEEIRLPLMLTWEARLGIPQT